MAIHSIAFRGRPVPPVNHFAGVYAGLQEAALRVVADTSWLRVPDSPNVGLDVENITAVEVLPAPMPDRRLVLLRTRCKNGLWEALCVTHLFADADGRLKPGDRWENTAIIALRRFDGWSMIQTYAIDGTGGVHYGGGAISYTVPAPYRGKIVYLDQAWREILHLHSVELQRGKHMEMLWDRYYYWTDEQVAAIREVLDIDKRLGTERIMGDVQQNRIDAILAKYTEFKTYIV